MFKKLLEAIELAEQKEFDDNSYDYMLDESFFDDEISEFLQESEEQGNAELIREAKRLAKMAIGKFDKALKFAKGCDSVFDDSIAVSKGKGSVQILALGCQSLDSKPGEFEFKNAKEMDAFIDNQILPKMKKIVAELQAKTKHKVYLAGSEDNFRIMLSLSSLNESEGIERRDISYDFMNEEMDELEKLADSKGKKEEKCEEPEDCEEEKDDKEDKKEDSKEKAKDKEKDEKEDDKDDDDDEEDDDDKKDKEKDEEEEDDDDKDDDDKKDKEKDEEEDDDDKDDDDKKDKEKDEEEDDDKDDDDDDEDKLSEDKMDFFFDKKYLAKRNAKRMREAKLHYDNVKGLFKDDDSEQVVKARDALAKASEEYRKVTSKLSDKQLKKLGLSEAEILVEDCESIILEVSLNKVLGVSTSLTKSLKKDVKDVQISAGHDELDDIHDEIKKLKNEIRELRGLEIDEEKAKEEDAKLEINRKRRHLAKKISTALGVVSTALIMTKGIIPVIKDLKAGEGIKTAAKHGLKAMLSDDVALYEGKKLKMPPMSNDEIDDENDTDDCFEELLEFCSEDI